MVANVLSRTAIWFQGKNIGPCTGIEVEGRHGEDGPVQLRREMDVVVSGSSRVEVGGMRERYESQFRKVLEVW